MANISTTLSVHVRINLDGTGLGPLPRFEKLSNWRYFVKLPHIGENILQFHSVVGSQSAHGNYDVKDPVYQRETESDFQGFKEFFLGEITSINSQKVRNTAGNGKIIYEKAFIRRDWKIESYHLRNS